MVIPDFQSFFIPVLGLTSDGKEHTTNELLDRIGAEGKFTPEDLSQKLSSGQSVFTNRVSWSIVYLGKAGTLERVRRSTYRITDRGRELLALNSPKLTLKDLEKYPEFATFRARSSRSAENREVNQEKSETPHEQLDKAYNLIREPLANEVLESVKKASPEFLEKLVVDLLQKMGYGGVGTVSGGPGDQGGTINQDKLGLEVVHLQAKRWSNPVGRPVVQAFAGSLEGARSRKGVLITTSTFSPDAVDYVKKIEKRIVLIDGKQLAELMIDYNLGVAETKAYLIKRLDSDYFDPA